MGGGSRAAAPVRVICGPTAAGKSALALARAARRPCTIIVADSRQIYRGFDIGTAKPTREERAAVAHRGIDIVEPTARYSAAAWAERADGWITEAERSGRVPIVVGGTGLYLRALFEPFFVAPELDPARRGALERFLASFSFAELGRWVRALDPERARLGRTQRLRAIEIALLAGRRLSALHVAHARPPRRRARYLLVDPGAMLQQRIAARVDAMLAAGWLEEVRQLVAQVPESAPAWNATGYRALRRVVGGEISVAAAREAIVVETRQYAKRQRTWFRHQLPGGVDGAGSGEVVRVDPLSAECADLVEQWWRSTAVDGEVDG